MSPALNRLIHADGGEMTASAPMSSPRGCPGVPEDLGRLILERAVRTLGVVVLGEAVEVRLQLGQ